MEAKYVRDILGQPLVEAALTMLLLFVILLAIWEAGRLIQVQQALTDAAPGGARRFVAPLTKPSALTTLADVTVVVQSYITAPHVGISQTSISVNSQAYSPYAPEITMTYALPKLLMGAPLRPASSLAFLGRSIFSNFYGYAGTTYPSGVSFP